MYVCVCVCRGRVCPAVVPGEDGPGCHCQRALVWFFDLGQQHGPLENCYHRCHITTTAALCQHSHMLRENGHDSSDNSDLADGVTCLKHSVMAGLSTKAIHILRK